MPYGVSLCTTVSRKAPTPAEVDPSIGPSPALRSRSPAVVFDAPPFPVASDRSITASPAPRIASGARLEATLPAA
jgi:hypothetical protein